VFLGNRRLSVESSLVRTAKELPTIVIGAGLSPVEILALGDRGVDAVPATDLGDALRVLKSKSIDSIVIEGGGRLAGSLLAQGLVDRFAWILSPVWLGDQGVPATRGFQVPSLMHADRWTVAERRALGQDTLLVFDRR